jgi:hypothetical protein
MENEVKTNKCSKNDEQQPDTTQSKSGYLAVTKSMDEEMRIKDIIQSIIDDSIMSKKMQEWKGFNFHNYFDVKMYRNIDVVNKTPYSVVVRNKLKDISLTVDHIKIDKEYSLDNMDTLSDNLRRMHWFDMEYNRQIADQIINIVRQDIFGYQHTNIGWSELYNNVVFKLYNIIEAERVIESNYVGNLRITQKGEYNEYIKRINELVIGRTRLELAWCVSVAGVLLSLLNIDDTNVVINYYGESGSGKTITSKVALSMFSLASKLFMSFNTTDNELERQFGKYQILPAVIDDKLVGEFGEISEKRTAYKLASQLFRLAEGHVKGRMNSKDSLIEYYCPIIMTAETSIVEAMKQVKADGQYHRIIEIHCDKGELTESIEHANKINEFLDNMGGVAAEPFIQYLMKRHSKESLMCKYMGFREEITACLTDKGINTRASNRIALIKLAAELLKECFQLEFHTQDITELLITSCQNAYEKADALQEQYKNILSYCQKHSNYFVETCKKANIEQHLGLIKSDETGRKVLQVSGETLSFILTQKEPQQYLDYIKENNITTVSEEKIKINSLNVVELIRMLRDKGYIKTNLAKTSKDALTTKVTLFTGDKQVPVYTIYLD